MVLKLNWYESVLNPRSVLIPIAIDWSEDKIDVSRGASYHANFPLMSLDEIGHIRTILSKRTSIWDRKKPRRPCKITAGKTKKAVHCSFASESVNRSRQKFATCPISPRLHR